MVESKSDPQIGYILRSYPRLSQTFILNEILALEKAGLALAIFACTNPREPVVQADTARVKAAVHYLSPEEALPSKKVLAEHGAEHAAVIRNHPAGYFRALAYTLLHPQLDQGYTAASRLDCFQQAVRLVRQLDRQKQRGEGAIAHLHAHFAHDPALIALLAHTISGIPYSFTAHARDLFQVPRAVLRERVQAAEAVVTCCQANLDYLRTVAPEERHKTHLIYHGVNLRGFHPPEQQDEDSGPPLILAVGRLIEKKGYLDLFQALRKAKDFGAAFRCEVYGDGPLEPALLDWIRENEMSAEICLAGNRTQEELIPIYRRAVFFALTPFIAGDGDRDGIPNVLVEAMASGLPVISTSVAGIPELVQHNLNGLLAAPHDVDQLAAGILALLLDPDLRRRLGRAARSTAEQFDVNRSAAHLKTLFMRLSLHLTVIEEPQVAQADFLGDITADIIAVTGRERQDK
jgi:glycosyltransferase involved in cell wall biosynthesis